MTVPLGVHTQSRTGGPTLISDRRKFLQNSIQVGAGSVLLAHASETKASAEAPRPQHGASASLLNLSELPARVYVQDEHGSLTQATRSGSSFSTNNTRIRCTPATDGTSVSVSCPRGPLMRILVRWDHTFPDDTLYLGDAWERSYGDLQWRFMQPERVLPWYFAAHHSASNRTSLLGVKTQPSALCFWNVDADGISLWMDFRNGGNPSVPGDREIPAATIMSMSAHTGENAFAALRRFCQVLCPSPRISTTPICGNNNWYYAYGMNFDANAMRRDAHFLAEISEGSATRPYCVIDAGWNPGGDAPGGPWKAGTPSTFPDMPGLAADIAKLGVKPGIWIRPTALSIVDNPRRLRSGPIATNPSPLDLTLPDNLTTVHEDVSRMRTWGYELIKHDFSTFDIFGRWGSTMLGEITEPRWQFHDNSLTNAEIILRLYKTLRDAAGSAVLLGCNTMGHLGAGLFDVQRTGDDTSGRAWERTRRMGVNTLAFRLAQNGTFFTCDADCAAHTEHTPWEMDKQFLDLVARSGTALFISADPTKVQPEQKVAFRKAMQTALAGGDAGGAEPLDWLHTTSPTQWRFGKEHVRYDWTEATGTLPFKA